MKNITQQEIADHFGISKSFLSLIKKGKKGFGKNTAKKLSERTGLPFESLMLSEGEKLYRLLELTYLQERGE